MAMFAKLNGTIRLYYTTFRRFRDEWELSGIEEQAYQFIAEAHARICEDTHADVDDLHLIDAVRIAHNAMELPKQELRRFNPTRRPMGWTKEKAIATAEYVRSFHRERRQRLNHCIEAHRIG